MIAYALIKNLLEEARLPSNSVQEITITPHLVHFKTVEIIDNKIKRNDVRVPICFHTHESSLLPEINQPETPLRDGPLSDRGSRS